MGVRRGEGGRFEPSPAVALVDALESILPAERPVDAVELAAPRFAVDPPWERQPGETVTAFGAFDAYRRLDPPRTLVRLCAVTGRRAGSVSGMERWSRAHAWSERVEVWDAHVRSAANEAIVADARTLGTRLRGIAENIAVIVTRATAAWAADPSFVPSPREAEVLARLAHRILGPELRAGDADERDPASLLAESDEGSDLLK